MQAQAAAGGLELQRTDVVDHHIHPLPLGERQHLGREILAPGLHHHGVRAQAVQQGGLVGGGGLGDHQRAGRARQLHRMHPQATAGTGDQHALAQAHRTGVAHRVQ